MKKCPFCKAEIEENARFCLYCMTSFEEKQEIKSPKGKNKRWLILAAVLVVVLIIFVAFLVFSNANTGGDDGSDVLENNASSVLTSDNEQSDFESDLSKNSKPQSAYSNAENSSVFSSNSSQNQGSNKTGNNVNSVSSKVSSVNSLAPSTTKTSSNKGEEKSSSDKPLTATTSTTSTLPTTERIEYIYRNAKYGDDFSVSANLENSIVITGVKTASSNGEYIIPSTINGKKVIAIMGNAFCDSKVAPTVKKVIVPSSVKTIWNYAFANCYNLTDIYFCGNSIYTEAQAFPESSKRNSRLIIHCSANCNDRNFRYYKNNASIYDAEYIEWNG